MVLEVLHPVVGSKTIPMDGDEIDMASAAALEEGGQVSKTLILVGAVADGGGTELDVAVVLGVERFQVFVPAVDGLADIHVGLSGEVGFVEGEEVFGAGGDGGFGVGFPARSVEWGEGVPEHGDEFLSRVNVTTRDGVPVVHPANVGVVELGG